MADLLLPDTPIESDELIPALLDASTEELEAVLWLFEHEQLQQLSVEAEKVLENLKNSGVEAEQAWENLQQIKAHMSD